MNFPNVLDIETIVGRGIHEAVCGSTGLTAIIAKDPMRVCICHTALYAVLGHCLKISWNSVLPATYLKFAMIHAKAHSICAVIQSPLISSNRDAYLIFLLIVFHPVIE